MIHRNSLSRFAVAVMLAVVVSASFTAIGVSVPNGSPTDLGGQPPGQAQSPTTSKQNAGNATASVVVTNQTTNGSTVTVKRATLPKGGFIVLSDDPYQEIGYLEESMIAVSQPLSPGTHRNITVNVSHSPPGGYQNQTALDTTSDYSVGVYRDGNNNSQFDFITSSGNVDEAYLVGSGTDRRYASDAATITIPGSRTPTPTASIRFQDQSTNGSSVTVRSVTLPRGGWVVVHNASYVRGGDPIQSAIGISTYLPSGTHHNVSVALVNGSVQHRQTLVAIPSQDTNNNQTYDYVRSGGFQDVPYTGDDGVITDRATVTVAASATPTAAPSSPTTTPVSTDAPRTVTGEAAGSESGPWQWLTAHWLIILAAIVVVAGGYLLVRRS